MQPRLHQPEYPGKTPEQGHAKPLPQGSQRQKIRQPRKRRKAEENMPWSTPHPRMAIRKAVAPQTMTTHPHRNQRPKGPGTIRQTSISVKCNPGLCFDQIGVTAYAHGISFPILLSDIWHSFGVKWNQLPWKRRRRSSASSDSNTILHFRLKFKPTSPFLSIMPILYVNTIMLTKQNQFHFLFTIFDDNPIYRGVLSHFWTKSSLCKIPFTLYILG